MTYTFKDYWYEKEIKVDDSIVFATVRVYGKNEKGDDEFLRRVGYEYFTIGSRRWKLKRAHKWADTLIKDCQDLESGRERYARLDK